MIFKLAMLALQFLPQWWIDIMHNIGAIGGAIWNTFLPMGIFPYNYFILLIFTLFMINIT